MSLKAPMLACCFLLTLGLLMPPSPRLAYSAEENLQETIDYLLEYVRASDVTFIRNNKEHSAEDAVGHITKKYKHYRKKIKTPEDFIRLSATKSTMSGKVYKIRTADGVTITSAEWLLQALEDYRQGKVSPQTTAPAEAFAAKAVTPKPGAPGAAAVDLQANPECPDSSRYEIRGFERDSGDCEETERNCATVKVRYPEIIETPIIDAEYALNAFILQALLKPLSEEEPIEDPEDLAEGFLAEYRGIREDMPDYSTGWFLERSVSLIHNTPHIVSIDLYETRHTGGAHPNSNRVYVSLDVSTGMTVTLSDILMDDQVKVLGGIAEREFRQMKGIPPDQGLDDAGFWFEHGKFRLNDNYAITGEGLVFYFNNYEIASYADGPTRLVIPGEDIKPLIRKDRLEWFAQSN